MKSIKIGRFGVPLQEIAFEDSETVNDALAAINETLKKGETLTISGETVRGSYIFEDGDVVIIEASTTGA
jgi:hypothetical protein